MSTYSTYIVKNYLIESIETKSKQEEFKNIECMQVLLFKSHNFKDLSLPAEANDSPLLDINFATLTLSVCPVILS